MATDVSTSLPDLDLAPGSTLTVTTGNASAIVTQLNVYGISPVTGEPVELEIQGVYPLFAYGPGT